MTGGRDSTRAANPGLHFQHTKVPSEPQIQVCISNTPRFHPSRVHFGNEKTRVAIFGRARFHPSRVRFLGGESRGSAWQEPRPPDGALPMAPARLRAVPMRPPNLRPPNPKQMETMFPDRANLRHGPRAPLGQDCNERIPICLHTAVGFACAYPNGFPASGAGVPDVVL